MNLPDKASQEGSWLVCSDIQLSHLAMAEGEGGLPQPWFLAPFSGQHMLCVEKVSRKSLESCSQVRDFPAAEHMTHFPAASPTNQLDWASTRAQLVLMLSFVVPAAHKFLPRHLALLAPNSALCISGAREESLFGNPGRPARGPCRLWFCSCSQLCRRSVLFAKEKSQSK